MMLTLYFAPAHHGLFKVWRQKHPHWRGGFVVRLLWLGFVVRWGRKRFYIEAMEEEH